MTVCFLNVADFDVGVYLRIAKNVDHNDHSKLPDNSHLEDYEKNFEKMDVVTQFIQKEQKIFIDNQIKKVFSVNELKSTNSKLMLYAILAVIIVKAIEIYFIRHKLSSKKVV